MSSKIKIFDLFTTEKDQRSLMILDRDLPRLLPGQRRQHVVVHGRAARAHPEQRDGGGVTAIVGDVLLDPPAVWEDIVINMSGFMAEGAFSFLP